MWFYDLMLFLFSQTWPDTWKSISKIPPSSKQELWWNGPNFQTALLKSRNFSWTLCCFPSRLVPSDVWQRDQHTSHVLPCFIIFIKVGFLSSSAMFFQHRVPQMSNSMVDHQPQKMLGRSIVSGAGFTSTPKAKQLTTSPRMRATRRWWTSWNQFLGINDPRADHRKWSMGWERLGSDHQKKVMLCYSNCTTPMTNSKGVSCKIWGLDNRL